MSKQQTAVEYLIEHLEEMYFLNEETLYEFEKAKEMEKEQIIETWHEGYDNESPLKDEENCGQQYYNDNFNQTT